MKKPVVFLAVVAGLFLQAESAQYVSHRADMAVERENSLAAVKRAHAYGVKGCEIDVRMRKDGVLALGHERLEPGADTFEDVVKFMAANGMFPLLDVKEPAAAAPAVALLRKYGLLDKTMTIVYSADEAKRHKSLDPAISPFILSFRQKGETDDAFLARYEKMFAESGADGAYLSMSNRQLAERFHANGRRVMFGSFTMPGEDRPFAAVGDFVIVDDPAFAGDCAGIEHDIPLREKDAAREWRLLDRDLRNRNDRRLAFPEAAVCNPGALLLKTDRDPLDVLLRRTLALADDLRDVVEPGFRHDFDRIALQASRVYYLDRDARYDLFRKAMACRRKIAFANPLVKAVKAIEFVAGETPLSVGPESVPCVLDNPFGGKKAVRKVPCGKSAAWAADIRAARGIPGSDSQVSVARGSDALVAGTLVVADGRKGGARSFRRVTPEQLVPGKEYSDSKSGNSASYATPWPLSDKYFLCVYDGDANAQYGTSPGRYRNYAITLVDVFGNRIRVYRDPAASCLNPVPLRDDGMVARGKNEK